MTAELIQLCLTKINVGVSYITDIGPGGIIRSHDKCHCIIISHD